MPISSNPPTYRIHLRTTTGNWLSPGPNERGCCRSCQTIITNPGLNLEPEPSHAGLVLVNGGLAFLRRVFGLGEEHAVVAGGLFGFAHAAGLYIDCNISVKVLFCRFACFGGMIDVLVCWCWLDARFLRWEEMASYLPLVSRSVMIEPVRVRILACLFMPERERSVWIPVGISSIEALYDIKPRCEMEDQ